MPWCPTFNEAISQSLIFSKIDKGHSIIDIPVFITGLPLCTFIKSINKGNNLIITNTQSDWFLQTSGDMFF